MPASADEPVRPTTYDAGEYPPPGAQPLLLVVGAATTAAWYGMALGTSYLFPDAPGASDLRVPVAGPWMALGNAGCADDDPDCDTFQVVLRVLLTTIDGVGQAGGVLAMVEGAFMPTMAPAPPRRSAPKPRLRRDRGPSFRAVPAPVVVGSGVGVGFVGVF